MKALPVLLGAAVLAVAGGLAWLVVADPASDDPAATDGGDERRPAGARGGGSDAPDGDPPKTAVRPPRKAPREPEPPLPEPPAELTPGEGARLLVAACPEVAKVDWRPVGIAVRRAQRDLRKFVRRLEQGEFPSELAMPIVEALRAIPGPAAPLFAPGGPTRPDPSAGAGTFLAVPPFEANALAATLDAWNRPLTDDQVARLEEIYAPYWELWSASAPSMGQVPWSLEAAVAVTLARAAMQPRIEAVLEDRQIDAVWPAEFAGRVGLDPLGGTMMWDGSVLVVEYDETQDVADSLAIPTLVHVGVPPEEGPSRDAAKAFFRSRPAAWRAGVRGPLSRAGYVTREELIPAIDGLPEVVAAARARFVFPSAPEPTGVGLAPPPQAPPGGPAPLHPFAPPPPSKRQAAVPARVAR